MNNFYRKRENEMGIDTMATLLRVTGHTQDYIKNEIAKRTKELIT